MGFSHLTFQEYLTALWFVNRSKLVGLTTIINKIPNSREAYLLAAGSMDDSSSFIDLIRSSNDINKAAKITLVSSILSESPILDSDYTVGVVNHLAKIMSELIVGVKATSIGRSNISKEIFSYIVSEPEGTSKYQ